MKYKRTWKSKRTQQTTTTTTTKSWSYISLQFEEMIARFRDRIDRDRGNVKFRIE